MRWSMASVRSTQLSLLAEAIDSAPVAVFVADENARYIAVNETACAMLGYERAELLELSVTDVAPWPETPRQYVEMIVGDFREGTTRLRRKDGSELRIAFRAAPTVVAGMGAYMSVVWPIGG